MGGPAVPDLTTEQGVLFAPDACGAFAAPLWPGPASWAFDGCTACLPCKGGGVPILLLSPGWLRFAEAFLIFP